jgi:signal transduction histidine kinase
LSPLVKHPPEYVKLYFNWLPDNRVLSPQCPTTETVDFVKQQGVTDQELSVYESRRHELEVSSSNGSLLAMLPAESFPVSRWDYLAEGNSVSVRPVPPAQVPGGQPQGLPESQPVVVTGNGTQPTGPPSQYDNAPSSQAPSRQPLPQPSQTSSGSLTPPTLNSPFAYTAPANNSGPRQSTGIEGQSEAPATQAVPLPQQNAQLQQRRVTSNYNRGQRGGENDFEQRISAYQQFTQQSVESFKSRNPDSIKLDALAAHPAYREGAFRPVWINGKLLFARRVQHGEQTLVQGCWLDWSQIERLLREEVSDILPKFLLVPVLEPRQAALNRVLATLPVQVEVPPLQPQSIQWTPVRLALVAAWAGLLLASLAAAVTLQGMIVLNERRASFVSAVTHELRTPLTTFRMYAEMLAEGMVPDPTQQKKYLTTLRTESDRLAHLVDNVLQYARLERGRNGKQRQRISLMSLLDRVETRLADRAQQAGLELRLDGSPKTRLIELMTDPSAIEQILFNLVDNAGKYAAHSDDKRLHLAWTLEPRMLALRVIDHGPGIETRGRPKLFLPFSKSVNEAAESAPGVGLGLALSRRLARALGGELTWEETAGGGATFCLRLPRA